MRRTEEAEMKLSRMIAALGLGAWVAGCACPTQNTVYQISTIDALMAGVYDGDLTLRELRRHGDQGLGTYDNLNGEMVLLDGEFYQVKADGRVYSPDLDGETPFAAVCEFRPEKTFAVPEGADMIGLEALIDQEAPNQNQFCAFRIEGQFKTMRTRSVPAQKRPFPPLKEVAATQPVFDMENVAGTVLGFRCPPFVAGVNVPGYHLHFISRDRARGGHILAFELVTGTAQVDMLDRLVMQLPGTKDFADANLSRDRQQDLKAVEKEKPMR
jgi:acetolactate decarboxylase